MSIKHYEYDLRVRKTHKLLFDALTCLLSQKKFGKITVNDICEKSLISRPAFYSHFNDKYDLLRRWLIIRKPQINSIRNSYIEFDKVINQVFYDNKNIIKNIFEEANNETIELLVKFISSLLSEFLGDNEPNDAGNADKFNIVLYNFCAGGIISLVSWQIKNKFPSDLKMMNVHFYKILDVIRQLENGNPDINERS